MSKNVIFGIGLLTAVGAFFFVFWFVLPFIMQPPIIFDQREIELIEQNPFRDTPEGNQEFARRVQAATAHLEEVRRGFQLVWSLPLAFGVGILVVAFLFYRHRDKQ